MFFVNCFIKLKFTWLEPVRDFKARHASTLLVFEATAEAATEIESRGADVAISA